MNGKEKALEEMVKFFEWRSHTKQTVRKTENIKMVNDLKAKYSLTEDEAMEVLQEARALNSKKRFEG